MELAQSFPLSMYVVSGRIFSRGSPNSKSMGCEESAEKMTYGGGQVALRGNINYVCVKSQQV